MFSPSIIKFFALLNIILQVAFPLVATFSPLIVSAKSESHFLNYPAPPLQTRVYTLASGENINTVAAKFNTSVTDLRKLNQFRTFANGFNNLKSGDELEVPLTPLPKVHWDKASDTVTESQNEQVQKVAGMATMIGGFLSGNPNERKATSTARGMATGQANGQLQQFLGKFGTARVQLNADDNFSLKNSQLDLLIPIYEQFDRLVFTQGSVHRTDDRSQANLGFGFRRFYGSWMMGANTFFDYDLSRDHARSGVGIEYGRDFLKLAGNGYTPLTGWKESPDVKGYEERPARGWELTAQGWIPALPQLGGKLTYEQYYGKEVALFGKDNRQHNPRAVTAGVTYTPVPLLTLTAEKRQGQSGKNDARFGLGLTWQPGVPLRHQLDSAGVGTLRTLAGGRYDFVERNNNIVLEYRKRSDLKLQTVDLVSGYSGEEKSLGVSVSSRYNLKQIEWTATELEAAGGRISNSAGNGYNVVLPTWQSSPNSSNSYIVSGVAIDSRGNRSNRSDTQVTVQAPLVNRDRSSFTPGESTLPADGESSQILTLTIRDDQNIPIDVDVAGIALSVVKNAETKVSVPVRKGVGVYEITVMAGTVSDTVKITPSVMAVSLSTAAVTIISNVPDGMKSTFSSSNLSIVADNLTTTTLTFQANDTTGHKITGIADSVKFLVKDETGAVVSSGVTVSNVHESSPGIYTALLKGSQTGHYTVIPQVNGSQVGELNADVVLVTGTVDGAQSTFTINNSSIPANNIDTTVLTLSAKDSHGNIMSGITKELSFVVMDSSGSTVSFGISVSTIKESSPGVYTSTLKGTLAGSFIAMPQLDGKSIGDLKAAVTLIAGAVDETKSTLTASEQSILADNRTTSTLTLVVKDINDNALKGIANDLLFAVRDANGTPVTAGVTVSNVMEGNKGIYTATVKGSQVGSYTFIPKLSGKTLSALSVVVSLTAGDIDSTRSTFIANQQTITADNIDDTTLTFTAKDQHNNAITGLSSSLAFVVRDKSNKVVTSGVTISNLNETGTAGIYTATMTGTLAGTFSVSPQLNGSSIGNIGVEITLSSGAVNDSQSSFAASEPSITADDTTISTLTFTARDQYKNIVTGLGNSLTFVVKNSGGSTVTTGVAVSTIAEAANTGVYIATLKGSLVGNYTVIPQISGIELGNLSLSVALTKIPELHLTTQVVINNAIANGISENIIRITLKDENGENVDSEVTVSLAAGDSQFVTYPSSLQLNNGTADLSVKSVKVGGYTFSFSASTPDTTALATQSVTFAIDDSKARMALTTDSEQLLAAYKESRHITLTLTDGDGNPFEESKSVSINVTSDNGVLSLAKVDGNDASGVITMQLPAGQTSKTFTFSSAIAGNYMINASYTPSTGSAITATVGEEATIEISGWKYKTTGGTGKTVSTSFRPSYIAQGDTAQILLNDTADYNSYYSFSLTGSNPAFSIDSDTVSLAPVITNASQVSAGASVTVGARNGTSQLTTSPVYALMASSGVISTGNGNTWLSWGNNASYCQKDGNNTVSMNDFKTYQSETGAIRTNNENSLWTGTSIANTQQAYFFAANGTFVAAGIYENKVGVCILPR